MNAPTVRKRLAALGPLDGGLRVNGRYVQRCGAGFFISGSTTVDTLNDAVLKAAESLRLCQGASQAAEAHRARQDEALGQARSRYASLQDAAAQATGRLADWLTAFNAGQGGAALELPDLRAALALGTDWLIAERESYQAVLSEQRRLKALRAQQTRESCSRREPGDWRRRGCADRHNRPAGAPFKELR